MVCFDLAFFWSGNMLAFILWGHGVCSFGMFAAPAVTRADALRSFFGGFWIFVNTFKIFQTSLNQPNIKHPKPRPLGCSLFHRLCPMTIRLGEEQAKQPEAAENGRCEWIFVWLCAWQVARGSQVERHPLTSKPSKQHPQTESASCSFKG